MSKHTQTHTHTQTHRHKNIYNSNNNHNNNNIELMKCFTFTESVLSEGTRRVGSAEVLMVALAFVPACLAQFVWKCLDHMRILLFRPRKKYKVSILPRRRRRERVCGSIHSISIKVLLIWSFQHIVKRSS